MAELEKQLSKMPNQSQQNRGQQTNGSPCREKLEGIFLQDETVYPDNIRQLNQWVWADVWVKGKA